MKNSSEKHYRKIEKIQNRIRKLKKVQIWPVITFFIISMSVAAAMVAAIISLFITYILQEKVSDAFQRTRYVKTVLENNLNQGVSYEKALNFLHGDGSFTNAVAILNENNELVAQYGIMTYNLDSEGSISVWDEYHFYLDTNSTGSIFGPGNNLDLSIRKLVKKCFLENKREDEQWMNTEICDEPYWLIANDNAHSLKILVKNEFILTRKDIIYIIGFAGGIWLLISIPILYLTCHLITNIVRQRRMYQLLSLDSVTGGNNWFYYDNRAGKIMNRSWNADKTYAVIHLTYNKYRSFCSCYGIKAGEYLLQQLTLYFEKNLNKGEICSHISEADFVILIKSFNREDAGYRVKQWFDEIPQILPQYHVSFHAGVCMVDSLPSNSPQRRRRVDASQIYHNASIARDAISETVEMGVLFFDDNMRAQQLWEHHVEECMDRALQNEEYQVYLQPKYNPANEELSGAEALVRWINSEDGFVPPNRFIPILEKDGLITKLDDYMISHVAALQMRWLSEGKRVVPVSVNVSRAHFTRPDLAEHICQLVDEHQLPHELLEIELTESAFFDDKEVLLKTVNALKQYGFFVSMDDFGAGYSSLNSLKELPLDVLKLDADFFRGEYEKERGDIVVSEAIRLAKNLNMKIVAEGIEEKDQVDFLAGLGCDMIQGYYFAKPMPASDYENKMGQVSQV